MGYLLAAFNPTKMKSPTVTSKGLNAKQSFTHLIITVA